MYLLNLKFTFTKQTILFYIFFINKSIDLLNFFYIFINFFHNKPLNIPHVYENMFILIFSMFSNTKYIQNKNFLVLIVLNFN